MIDYKKRIQMLYEQSCPYYDLCKANVYYEECDTILCKFRFDRARVGKNYGKESFIPKIVMVGIEGFPKEKTVSRVIEPSYVATNPHYNGLKYVLSYLLSDFVKKDKPEPRITQNSVWWIKDALSRYCLCNLYRCAFVPENAPDKKKGLCHTEEMKENCFELLLSEISALDPDVIVIQATDTAVFPENNLEKLLSRFQCANEYYGKSNRARLYTGRLNNHKIQIVQTLHGAYGGFKSHTYLSQELNPVLDKTIELVKSMYH